MALQTTGKQIALEAVLVNGYYIGLLTNLNLATEVTSAQESSYQRQPVISWINVGNVRKNQFAIEFGPRSLTTALNIDAIAIYDSVTGGNILWTVNITNIDWVQNSIIRFNAESLSFSFT
jgi:hypothetical protein